MSEKVQKARSKRDALYDADGLLLREAPVYHIPGTSDYLVTRRADIIAIARDTGTFSNRRIVPVLELVTRTVGCPVVPTTADNDPPSHRAYRDVARKAFTPGKIKGYEEMVRGHVQRLIDEFKPSAVFLDLGMPDMDGFEVAHQIRSRPNAQDTVLIALTGWSQERDKRRTAEAGFNRHLAKPADLETLQAVLTSLAS